MIVAVPFAIAVTSPAEEIVAFVVSEDAHVRLTIVLSLASFTVGVRVAVSANDANERLVGDSVIELATWDTVAVAVLFTEPEVAVIVAVPLPTEVTSPADDTVAIEELDVAQVTVALDMVFPDASFTVGTSVVVSPNDAKLRLVGESVTDAAA